MKALRITAIICLVMSALVSVQAQLLGSNPPFCEDVLNALAAKNIQVLQSLNGFLQGTRRIANVLCIDSLNFRVQRFFYCPEGYTALVLPQSNTVTAVDLSSAANTGFSNVVDLDQLSEQLNATVVLFCLKPRIPPTPSPTPPPPMLGSCPRGPTRMRSYIRQHHTRLCRFRCSFGVSSQGASIGTRTRNVYWCCEQYGDPIIVSRASRLYRCGPL